MKKILTFCLVLSTVLFTLGLSGCDGMLSASDDGDGLFSRSGNSGNVDTGGRLTITGISGSGINGTYNIYVKSSSSETSYNSGAAAYGSVTINSSTSTATVNLYTNSGSRWTGSGYYYFFIENSSGQLVYKSSGSISFTNGVASVTVSSFTEIPQSLLTITGIDSGFYGTYDVYVNSSAGESSYDSGAAAHGSVTISGSTATVDLSAGTSSSARWTGTGPYYVFLKNRSAGQLAAKTKTQISFTNGVAAKSISLSEFDVTGRLTVTGITGDFYGTYNVYVNSSDDESSYDTGAAASALSVTINSSTGIVDFRTGSTSTSRWSASGVYYVFIEDPATRNFLVKSDGISFTNGHENVPMSHFAGVTPGLLTITGISSGSYGSYQVYVISSDSSTTYATGAVASVTINSSTVTVDLYDYANPSSRWDDAGNYYVFLADSSGSQPVAVSGLITFANGSATISASYLVPVGLTITGIDSGSYGRSYQVYVNSSDSSTNYDTGAVAYGSVTLNSSSTATVDLYEYGSSSSRWNGTGSYYVFLEYTDGTISKTTSATNFVLGTATVSFSDFDFISATSP